MQFIICIFQITAKFKDCRWNHCQLGAICTQKWNKLRTLHMLPDCPQTADGEVTK